MKSIFLIMAASSLITGTANAQEYGVTAYPANWNGGAPLPPVGNSVYGEVEEQEVEGHYVQPQRQVVQYIQPQRQVVQYTQPLRPVAQYTQTSAVVVTRRTVLYASAPVVTYYGANLAQGGVRIYGTGNACRCGVVADQTGGMMPVRRVSARVSGTGIYQSVLTGINGQSQYGSGYVGSIPSDEESR